MIRNKLQKKGILVIAILTFFYLCLNGCQSDYITKSLEYPGKCSVDLKIGIGSSIGYMPVSKSGTTYICGTNPPAGCMEGRCYPSQNATIYAIDDDCTVKWKYDTGIADYCVDICLAIGEEGNIYFIQYPDLSKTNLYSLSPKGKLNWKVDLGSDYCKQMAIGSDGTIYIQSSVTLSAVSPAGEIKWNIPLNRIGGPIIGPEDNIYVAHEDVDEKFHLSTFSKEGQLNLDYDFGTDEFPVGAVIGPSGNIYTISIAKKEGIGGKTWYYGFLSNSASGEIYLNSFNQNFNLNWKVKIDEGNIVLGPGYLFIGEDETIFINSLFKLKAIEYADGSLKWEYEQTEDEVIRNNAHLRFIDGQGDIYYLGDYEGKVFDREGKIISTIYPPKKDNLFGLGFIMNGDYFYNVGGGGLIIYYVLGSGYSKSAWPMLFHDPQNTNRWNGGS